MAEISEELEAQRSEGPQSVFVRRNYLLGIANGTIGQLGFSLVNVNLLLAAFVYQLTGSKLLVGLTVALDAAGLVWPQLLMSSRIEHQRRKKPFYVAFTAIRIAMVAGMATAMWLSGAGRAWALALFLFFLFAFDSAVGAGNMPFWDMVGRSVTPERLGRFFAYRALFGSSLTVLASYLLVQPILEGLKPPASFALLATVGLVMMGAAWILFCFCREREQPDPPPARGFRRTLRDAWQMLRRERNYRLLLAKAMLARFNDLMVAFYVPYGVDRLGATRMSGVFLGCFMASRLASSLTWGKMSDTRGNRLCLVWAGVFYALAPGVVIAAPHLPALFSLSVPFVPTPLDLRLCVFLAALCLYGFATQANMIGTNAFLLESAPRDRWSSYIAFLESVCAPLTLLPLAAGALVSVRRWGLEALFALVAVCGVLTLLTVLRLREVRRPTARVQARPITAPG